MPLAQFLPRESLSALFDALHDAGYRIVGPRVREGAIVYDTVNTPADLPCGVTDEQAPGSYRLKPTGDARNFSWSVGPQGAKPLLFRPHEVLWRASGSQAEGLRFEAQLPEAEKVALLALRPCDLHALAIQDEHFMTEPLVDPYYQLRRENLFTVVAHCTHGAETCFCSSTGDGPGAIHGFDLAFTELDDGLVIGAASEAGEAILARLPTRDASGAQCAVAEEAVEHVAETQRRRLPSRNLRAALFSNLAHPRWEEVGARCLSCGNCTMVCPTCFCHTEGEMAALDGSHSDHFRQWDSCFTEGHSYIHGFVVREERPLRYRQWLTHKLGSWHDQYGRSGCTGCGRCITWCPVGIDITEEATAICGGEERHG